MHPIIYDVAVSRDGYISGPNGDISQFAHDGPVVDDYAARMAEYTAAIMGRTTYEFGYAYGLAPGQNPYPHMQTHVFSETLCCPENCDVSVVRSRDPDHIQDLKAAACGPIYLCGGGAFASWLLAHGLIDRLILKRAPIVLGGGTKLFGETPARALPQCQVIKRYDNGYLLEHITM
ncbi:dihydrofolate reductase family protein [Roseobacteraceae bacterium S113]